MASANLDYIARSYCSQMGANADSQGTVDTGRIYKDRELQTGFLSLLQFDLVGEPRIHFELQASFTYLSWVLHQCLFAID